MKMNFFQFVSYELKNFLEAAFNIIVFLPFYFSITVLVRTLFYPWKNLVTAKKSVGFSFNDWLNTLSYNMISSLVGFFVRFSTVVAYFIIEFIYILVLPIAFAIFIILTPIFYLEYLLTKPEETVKKEFVINFISKHLLKQENLNKVNQWANEYYQKEYHKSHWWKLSNLFLIRPIGKDWAVGYTPTLNQYCDELTSPSYQYRIKNIIGRQTEINEIEKTLTKNVEANVVIVGEEGVGKHTIIDALAKHIYEGRVNPLLMYKRVLKVNMEKILTRYTDQKQRENFFEDLIGEAAAAHNVILLMENLDRYVSSGEGRIDLTTAIEKYTKNSASQIVGITTPFFYQKFIFSNAKINRFFTKIDVNEVSKEEAEQVLIDCTPIFENRYRLTIPYETIIEVINKSDFFITYIPFPEKAIELLDTACAYTKDNKKSIVLPEIVDDVLSEKTHIPTRLSEDIKTKLVDLENLLREKVVHQDQALVQIASSLRRSFILIGQRKKPLASFLFLGPTGVGKTETAKAIAKTFFDGEKSLLRFDMSLYQLKEDIPKLIGSIDTNNPGLLATAIREKPYGVLLLDEIEKANKDLINIFLTVIDEGYFTDGYGKRIDCKNLVIVATSNAGSDQVFQSFSKNAQTDPIVSTSPNSLIDFLITNRIFSPEFLNRFDGVVAFNPLTQTSVLVLARKMINRISGDILKLYKVTLNVSDTYLADLATRGYDERFGARNMERIIREEIEDKAAKMILGNQIKEGETINL